MFCLFLRNNIYLFAFLIKHQIRSKEFYLFLKIYFFVLNFRFKEVSDKINKYGPQTSSVFAQLKTPVKQIVIGPGHLGLLLEDGRAYRVAFSVIPDRLDLNKQEPVKRFVVFLLYFIVFRVEGEEKCSWVGNFFI